MGAIVKRGFVGQLAIGNLGDDLAVVLHAQQAVVGDSADGDGVQTPLLEDLENFVFAAFLGDEQHALLGFGEHHFVRRHAGFALRDQVEIDLDADSAAAAHFAGEEVSPAAPMSWMATIAPVFMASRQASSSSFSRKGSPTWTLGRFCLDSSVNSADAMDAP